MIGVRQRLGETVQDQGGPSHSLGLSVFGVAGSAAERENAATKIQAVGRGHNSRRQLTSWRTAEQASAARALQARLRGRQARCKSRELRKQRQAAVQIQAAQRGKWGRRRTTTALERRRADADAEAAKAFCGDFGDKPGQHSDSEGNALPDGWVAMLSRSRATSASAAALRPFHFSPLTSSSCQGLWEPVLLREGVRSLAVGNSRCYRGSRATAAGAGSGCCSGVVRGRPDCDHSRGTAPGGSGGGPLHREGVGTRARLGPWRTRTDDSEGCRGGTGAGATGKAAGGTRMAEYGGPALPAGGSRFAAGGAAGVRGCGWGGCGPRGAGSMPVRGMPSAAAVDAAGLSGGWGAGS